MLKYFKVLFILGGFSLFLLSLTGCYTQIGSPGVQSDIYDNEYYSDESRDDDAEPYWDEYEREEEPEVVYHQYDHDVYVEGGYAPAYLNSWWYEPYWYYSANPWYAPGYYDPYWGYDPYLYDPYYWPSAYYGGWGYHHYHYLLPYPA